MLDIIVSFGPEKTLSALVYPQVNKRISEDSKGISELFVTRWTGISLKSEIYPVMYMDLEKSYTEIMLSMNISVVLKIE